MVASFGEDPANYEKHQRDKNVCKVQHFNLLSSYGHNHKEVIKESSGLYGGRFLAARIVWIFAGEDGRMVGLVNA